MNTPPQIAGQLVQARIAELHRGVAAGRAGRSTRRAGLRGLAFRVRRPLRTPPMSAEASPAEASVR